MALIPLILCAVFAIAAITLIARSTSLREKSYLTPLFDARERQQLTVDQPCVLVVYEETVHARFRLRTKWRYFLWDRAKQAYIESRWAQNSKVIDGQYAQRWVVRYFDVPHPGDYEVVIDGLEPDDELKVIIGRYSGQPLLYQVAGIVGLLAAGASLFAFFVLVS